MILFACNSFTLLVRRNFSNTHDAILLHATSRIVHGGLREKEMSQNEKKVYGRKKHILRFRRIVFEIMRIKPKGD